jgi:NitT/TauT family transport system permease protein
MMRIRERLSMSRLGNETLLIERTEWFRWRGARYVVPLVVAIVIIGTWEFGVRTAGTPEYMLPAPSQVWRAFQMRWDTLLVDTLLTGAEAVAGFLMATAVAIVAAVVFAHSRLLRGSFMPYLIALKAVPLIAIAPMLILWLGNGLFSKAVMAGTISFFPVVVNLTQGLCSVPQERVELFRSLYANPFQVFFLLRIPNSLPYFVASLKISSTLSVVGAIVAEFSGANRGIGNVIMVAALRIDTPLLFCGIVLVSLLGIVLYYVIDAIGRKVVFWEKTA